MSMLLSELERQWTERTEAGRIVHVKVLRMALARHGLPLEAVDHVVDNIVDRRFLAAMDDGFKATAELRRMFIELRHGIEFQNLRHDFPTYQKLAPDCIFDWYSDRVSQERPDIGGRDEWIRNGKPKTIQVRGLQNPYPVMISAPPFWGMAFYRRNALMLANIYDGRRQAETAFKNVLNKLARLGAGDEYLMLRRDNIKRIFKALDDPFIPGLAHVRWMIDLIVEGKNVQQS